MNSMYDSWIKGIVNNENGIENVYDVRGLPLKLHVEWWHVYVMGRIQNREWNQKEKMRCHKKKNEYMSPYQLTLLKYNNENGECENGECENARM